MTTWEENVSNFPELEEIKNWLIQGNKNDFYESIVRQANKRILSQAQIDAAQKSFNKIKNPPKSRQFNDYEVKAFSKIFSILSSVSPMGSEFYKSLSNQLNNKKQLSEKQWDLSLKKMYRFRKSILRTLFTGRSKKN